MHTSKMPKTIQKWIDSHLDMIDEYWVERDEFGKEDGDGEYSVWVYFKKGWINMGITAHLIHECTVKDFMDQVSFIQKCECDDCK